MATKILLLLASICLLGSFCVQSPRYSLVVVDATSNQPISGALVQINNEKASVSTDHQGFAQVSVADSFKIRIHHLGYAQVEMKRSIKSGLVHPDTFRLLPQEYVLPAAVVRPRQKVLLSPIDKRQKSAGAVMTLVPGHQVAVLNAPLDTQRTYSLNAVQVHFDTGKFRAGQVRIRVVNVLNAAPGPYDLLPAAAIYSAAQLNELPRHTLTIDLPEYAIKIPKEGVCVILEGVSDKENEQYITMTMSQRGNSKPAIVLGTDSQNPATYRTVNYDEFPAVKAILVQDGAVTWRRSKTQEPWKLLHGPGRRKQGAAAVAVAQVDVVAEVE